jgi:hypothetical protein
MSDGVAVTEADASDMDTAANKPNDNVAVLAGLVISSLACFCQLVIPIPTDSSVKHCLAVAV